MLQSRQSQSVAPRRAAAPAPMLLTIGRTAGLIVALVIGLAAGAPEAGAQPTIPQSGASVFTVSDIEVDATASDAVSARTQAVRQGQQAGLDRLLRRLVPAEEQARLPWAANLPIDDYVQSFQIAD